MVRLHLPSFEGATAWLNTEPLGPDQLRGHVVLVDFWTLTCINWLRTEPYVRAWSQTYRDDGLVVVGVHTPEFSFEHEIDRVRLATKERDIDYPVVVDNDYAVWSAFDNHYWPALYFVGPGRQHPGPPLRRRPLRGVGAQHPTAARCRARASWPSMGSVSRPRPTGTTCGHRRRTSATGAASTSRHRASRCASTTGPSTGGWTVERERVVLDQAGGSIAYRFHARDVHLVLSVGAGRSIPFRVLLDGLAPGASHGLDIDEEGQGVLQDGRLYQLVRQDGEVRERTVEITFLEAGAEAYVFTFG